MGVPNEKAVMDTLREIRDDARRRIRTHDHATPHHRADEWLRQVFEAVLQEQPLTEQDLREECIALETVSLTTQVAASGARRSTGQIAHEGRLRATEKAQRLGGWQALWDDWNRDPDGSQA